MEEPVLEKIQGLDLILKSINCEKYKSKFQFYGINEHTIILLTESDLKYLDIQDKDLPLILNAINVLKTPSTSTEIILSNDDVSNLQSNICGQLGTIALMLNYIYHSISNTEKFDDILIDNCLSSFDAALMLKPYIEAEEKNIEKTLTNVYKIKKRKPMLITTTVCTAFLIVGLTLWHLNKNKPFVSISTYSNWISLNNIWRI